MAGTLLPALAPACRLTFGSAPVAASLLSAGDRVPGVELSYGLEAPSFLRGRLDLRCAAAAGHRCAQGQHGAVTPSAVGGTSVRHAIAAWDLPRSALL